ncbi:MAG: thermonuclease family protein [Aquificaceae bacterium]
MQVRLIGVGTPAITKSSKAKWDAERSGKPIEEVIKMGRLSKKFTEKLLPRDGVVYLEFDVQKIDKYGRLLAYAWLPDGRMLNEILLKEGYAYVYTVPPNVKYKDTFIAAQKYARENKKGLWGMGRF